MTIKDNNQINRTLKMEHDTLKLNGEEINLHVLNKKVKALSILMPDILKLEKRIKKLEEKINVRKL